MKGPSYLYHRLHIGILYSFLHLCYQVKVLPLYDKVVFKKPVRIKFLFKHVQFSSAVCLIRLRGVHALIDLPPQADKFGKKALRLRVSMQPLKAFPVFYCDLMTVYKIGEFFCLLNDF